MVSYIHSHIKERSLNTYCTEYRVNYYSYVVPRLYIRDQVCENRSYLHIQFKTCNSAFE